MKIQDKITFFHTLEAKIWKDKVEANPYLATLSILIVAVSGALVGGSETLRNWFEWNFDISTISIIGSCIFLWGYNLAESIIASKTATIAILRSLLLLVLMAVAFCLGYAAAVVVIAIVTVVAIILGIMLIMGGLTGRGNKLSLKNEETGEKVKVQDMGILGHIDSSGHRYEKELDGKFHRKD